MCHEGKSFSVFQRATETLEYWMLLNEIPWAIDALVSCLLQFVVRVHYKKYAIYATVSVCIVWNIK